MRFARSTPDCSTLEMCSNFGDEIPLRRGDCNDLTRKRGKFKFLRVDLFESKPDPGVNSDPS